MLRALRRVWGGWREGVGDGAWTGGRLELGLRRLSEQISSACRKSIAPLHKGQCRRLHTSERFQRRSGSLAYTPLIAMEHDQRITVIERRGAESEILMMRSAVDVKWAAKKVLENPESRYSWAAQSSTRLAQAEVPAAE